MTIDVYANKHSPPSKVVLMAIKQLNLDVNHKSLDVKNQENRSPQFLKINPAHCVPTIVDGDLALWESRAIVQYLFNKYAPDSPLYPTDPKKRAVIDRTLNFDMALFSSIREALLSKLYSGAEPTEQQLTNFKNNLKLLDTLIGSNNYVTGNEFTIADLSVLASLTTLILNDFKDLDDVPNVKRWFERLSKELPYYEEINGGDAERIKHIKQKK